MDALQPCMQQDPSRLLLLLNVHPGNQEYFRDCFYFFLYHLFRIFLRLNMACISAQSTMESLMNLQTHLLQLYLSWLAWKQPARRCSPMAVAWPCSARQQHGHPPPPAALCPAAGRAEPGSGIATERHSCLAALPTRSQMQPKITVLR